MNVPRPGTPLDPIVDRYLQWKRALGRSYLGVERVLVSLLQFMYDRAAADLDQKLFDAWSTSFADLTANVRRNRQREVRNFCLYRQRTEPNCFVPDTNRFPRPVPVLRSSNLWPGCSGPYAGHCWAATCDARLAASARRLATRRRTPLHRRPAPGRVVAPDLG
jgi:hypothetical protein